jgi:hypothetical protein
MKSIAVLLFLCIAIFTACAYEKNDDLGNSNYNEFSSSSIFDGTHTTENFIEIENITTINDKSNKTDKAVPDDDIEYINNNLVFPWLEEDLYQLWLIWDKYTDLFDSEQPFIYYYFDVDDDTFPEVIFRVKGYDTLFVFSKTNDAIIEIPSKHDFDITYGTFLMPPVFFDKDFSIFLEYNNTFPMINIYNGDCYITGISIREEGAKCWIKQLVYAEGAVKTKNLYHWGYFKEMMWEYFELNFYYRGYDNYEYISVGTDYFEVSPDEIKNFLILIYGDKYKELYP